MMAGHKKFRDLVAHIDDDPVARAQIEAEKRAMDDIIALTKLRERRGAQRSTVANTPGVSQSDFPELQLAMDDDEDLYLSTLRHYIEALGGRLEIAAVFPDETIRLVPAAVESERPAPARS